MKGARSNISFGQGQLRTSLLRVSTYHVSLPLLLCFVQTCLSFSRLSLPSPERSHFFGCANQVSPSLELSAPWWATSVIFLGACWDMCMGVQMIFLLECVWGICYEKSVIFLYKPCRILLIMKKPRVLLRGRGKRKCLKEILIRTENYFFLRHHS